MDVINQIISTGVKILKKRTDVYVDEKFAQELQKELDKQTKNWHCRRLLLP